jgi:hypothetical protein
MDLGAGPPGIAGNLAGALDRVVEQDKEIFPGTDMGIKSGTVALVRKREVTNGSVGRIERAAQGRDVVVESGEKRLRPPYSISFHPASVFSASAHSSNTGSPTAVSMFSSALSMRSAAAAWFISAP